MKSLYFFGAKKNVILYFTVILAFFIYGCAATTNEQKNITSNNLTFYNSYDCVGVDSEYVTRNWSEFQTQLDKGMLNYSMFPTSTVAGDTRIFLYMEFIKPDFEYSENNVCTKDCSKISCEYLSILTNGQKKDCYALPEKTIITVCARGGYDTGYVLTCKNQTANYQQTCIFFKSLQDEFNKQGFCEQIPIESRLKNYCITQQAVTEGIYETTEYCDMLTGEINTPLCYSDLARKLNRTDLCKKFIDGAYKDMCYH